MALLVCYSKDGVVDFEAALYLNQAFYEYLLQFCTVDGGYMILPAVAGLGYGDSHLISTGALGLLEDELRRSELRAFFQAQVEGLRRVIATARERGADVRFSGDVMKREPTSR